MKKIKFSGITLGGKKRSNCCGANIGVVRQELTPIIAGKSYHSNFTNGFVCLECGNPCNFK